MKYYSICLDINGKNCIVVGGGRVAERKVKGLLASGGEVSVISPKLTDELVRLAENGTIKWQAKGYEQGDLKGAYLVIAATDDTHVQELVHAEAEADDILVNVADVPDKCRFILPALVKRGDLSIAVSTAGNSPAMAKKLRQQLEKQFGLEYEKLICLLGWLRPLVMSGERPQKENEAIFFKILETEILNWIADKDVEKIQSALAEICGIKIDSESWDEIKSALLS